MFDVLSLVSIQTLPYDTFYNLYEAGIDRVAIAPSHCGILNLDGSIEYEPTSPSGMASNIEIGFHSMQGVLFGIDPTTPSLDIVLENRFNSIGSICTELGIKNVVVGSPAFRTDTNIWQSVLNHSSNCLAEGDFIVSIENICPANNLEKHDPYGPCGKQLSRFSRVLDISNAIDCGLHFLELIESGFEYSMFHASGKHHLALDGYDEARLITDIIRLNPNVKDCVWEFNDGTIQALIDSYRKSKILLS